MRPVHHVAPDEPVSGLLRRFVDEHIHIAVVDDEHGRTLGLLTMEDIMEQMVGRIEDEFDRLPRMVHKLSGGTIMAGGGTLMGELAEAAGFPVEDPGMTVCQWAAERLGAAPARGAAFAFAEYECAVRRVRRGKVFELALVNKRKPPV
jgi:putative hemolysin